MWCSTFTDEYRSRFRNPTKYGRSTNILKFTNILVIFKHLNSNSILFFVLINDIVCFKENDFESFKNCEIHFSDSLTLYGWIFFFVPCCTHFWCCVDQIVSDIYDDGGGICGCHWICCRWHHFDNSLPCNHSLSLFSVFLMSFLLLFFSTFTALEGIYKRFLIKKTQVFTSSDFLIGSYK